RTFLPALTLMRRVIADSRADKAVDFLYGDPFAPADVVLKAAGFSTIGRLVRFALPLGGRRWYTDVAARIYQTMVRLRAWNQSAEAVEHDAQRFDTRPFEQPADVATGLRPFRPSLLYSQRLAGYPRNTDHWFTFHSNGRPKQPSAAALVRGRPDGTATLYSLSREPSLPLSAVVPPLGAALRRAGYRRLFVVTLAGTHFARELERAGFVRREDSGPVMVCALTEAGADAIGAAATWEITQLDVDW
ncbi:MAG: hypothetical protein ABR499_06335, partial [Gemmatimonadaceae bacterium]